MGKGKDISEPNRRTIVKLKNDGKSLNEIGNLLNLKKASVQT